MSITYDKLFKYLPIISSVIVALILIVTLFYTFKPTASEPRIKLPYTLINYTELIQDAESLGMTYGEKRANMIVIWIYSPYAINEFRETMPRLVSLYYNYTLTYLPYFKALADDGEVELILIDNPLASEKYLNDTRSFEILMRCLYDVNSTYPLQLVNWFFNESVNSEVPFRNVVKYVNNTLKLKLSFTNCLEKFNSTLNDEEKFVINVITAFSIPQTITPIQQPYTIVLICKRNPDFCVVTVNLRVDLKVVFENVKSQIPFYS